MSAAAPDPFLYLEEEALEGESVALAGGVAVVCSLRCPGKESPNEDSAALIPVDEGSAVLAVADGVGGVRSGGVASGLALRSLAESLASGDRGDLRSAVLDGIERANAAVQELAVGAATTIAALEFAGGAVRPYHVGDSTILVVGQRGKLKLQTVAHSPVGFAVEAGVIDARDAMHHEDRHLVSNVLGSQDMRIEVGATLPLARHDTVLIASDGLLDNLHVDEIVECCRSGPAPDAARELARQARLRMTEPSEGHPSKPDDLTFVLFRPAGR